jgi:hypothetical protein
MFNTFAPYVNILQNRVNNTLNSLSQDYSNFDGVKTASAIVNSAKEYIINMTVPKQNTTESVKILYNNTFILLLLVFLFGICLASALCCMIHTRGKNVRFGFGIVPRESGLRGLRGYRGLRGLRNLDD